MSKIFLSLLLLMFSSFALAGSICDKISSKQPRPPLEIEDGIICFEEMTKISTAGIIYKQWTTVYFIPHEQKPETFNKRLHLSHVEGVIVDAFILNFDAGEKGGVVLIFAEKVLHPDPGSSDTIYSVQVFTQNIITSKSNEKMLDYNRRASGWLGYDFSWYSDEHKIIYKFPYMTQKSIREALHSPYAPLMLRDEIIPVIVKRKSHLYEYSGVHGKTKKYLIAGDEATVDEYKKGWCRVNYSGGKKPLQMWMMCDALEPDTGKQ
ncbi:MAG: hypothetical protein LBU76_10895 [Azoarcus sp.]|nr:hypothetical protein [Azoarcus sp.]